MDPQPANWEYTRNLIPMCLIVNHKCNYNPISIHGFSRPKRGRSSKILNTHLWLQIAKASYLIQSYPKPLNPEFFPIMSQKPLEKCISMIANRKGKRTEAPSVPRSAYRVGQLEWAWVQPVRMVSPLSRSLTLYRTIYPPRFVVPSRPFVALSTPARLRKAEDASEQRGAALSARPQHPYTSGVLACRKFRARARCYGVRVPRVWHEVCQIVYESVRGARRYRYAAAETSRSF